MGAGGSPRRSGRISGVFAARPGLRGLPTAPTGGAKGGYLLVIYLQAFCCLILVEDCASYNRRGICCLRP